MRSRRFMFILLCLLCGAGAWLLWHHGRSSAEKHVIAPSAVATRSLSTAPQLLPVKAGLTKATKTAAAVNTNQFAYRLSNTTKSLDQLVHDDRAILLENALIDTANPLNLAIPANLQAAGDPGAYIVQARGPIDNAFRALLAQSGATVVSYIPNNAYLVRASSGVAGMLEAKSVDADGRSLRALLQNLVVNASDGRTKIAFFRADENQPTSGAFAAGAGGETSAIAGGNLFDARFVQRRRAGNNSTD